MVLHHGMAINQFNRRWLDNVMATAITNIFSWNTNIIFQLKKILLIFMNKEKIILIVLYAIITRTNDSTIISISSHIQLIYKRIYLFSFTIKGYKLMCMFLLQQNISFAIIIIYFKVKLLFHCWLDGKFTLY